MNVRVYIALFTPMSRTRPALSPNSFRSWSGRPNSFTSRAPDTLKRSVMVAFIAALSVNDSRVMVCRRRPTNLAGRRKAGTTTSASSVRRHSSYGHGPEGEREVHGVGHDAAERAGERLLRADDVVVHAADERAGLGAGEEAEGHPLHVVVQRRAQVEDQSLADAGGVPAPDDGEGRLRDGQAEGQRSQPVDQAEVMVRYGGVDDALEDERREDAHQR